MSTTPGQPDPVDQGDVFATFLGITIPGEDPVVLLALPSQPTSEEAIITALQRQLARVAAHPAATTPEADEVRLALHAAAARMLDPQRRRAATGDRPPVGADDVVKAEPAEAMPMQGAILLTLGMYGGWNTRSFRRMTLLARRQGIGADELAETIRGLTRRSAAPGAARAVASLPAVSVRGGLTTAAGVTTVQAGATPRRVFEPAPDEVDPSNALVRNLLLVAGLGVLGLIAVAVVLIVLVSGGGPRGEDGGDAVKGAEPIAGIAAPPAQIFPAQPRTGEPLDPARAGREQGRVGDWNDLLRELSACTGAIDVDPVDASKRFAVVFSEAGRTWDEAQPDGLVAAVDGVVEYLYRASGSAAELDRTIGAISEGATPLHGNGLIGADQVMPAAWSAGILARLSREKDLPTSARDRLRAALGRSFAESGPPGEASFRAGSIGALSMMPMRFITSLPKGGVARDGAGTAWEQWLRAVSAIDGQEGTLYSRTVLLALQSVLETGPEPTQSQEAFDAVSVLVTALRWRTSDDSRRWLLRWFEAPSVSNGDLYAVTKALANKSSAEGVDTSMVLSLAGGESQRTELRDRYAAVWGMSTAVTRDALLQRWIDDVRVALERTEVGSAPAERLAYAVSMARLSQAAAMIWTGDTAGVIDVLQQTPPKPPAGPAGGGTLQNVHETGWALRYLGAGHNITQRREILTQVSATPTPVEAEVLVEEACRGSPPQLRAEARALVMRHGRSPAVINAMLEFAPSIPQTIDNTEMVEHVASALLPNVREPAWRVAVRRALVERLTQALADESDHAFIEQLSVAFSQAYTPPPPRPTVVEPPDPTAPAGEAVTLAPAAVCAGALRGQWQRQAEALVATGREPMGLAEIATRRSARLKVANGLVQHFAAEQVNTCELMGFVLVAEDPSRIGAVVTVLEGLGEARRKAVHIFEQVEAAERARLLLWLARYGEQS